MQDFEFDSDGNPITDPDYLAKTIADCLLKASQTNIAPTPQLGPQPQLQREAAKRLIDRCLVEIAEDHRQACEMLYESYVELAEDGALLFGYRNKLTGEPADFRDALGLPRPPIVLQVTINAPPPNGLNADHQVSN
jgi:hypothetical protein